MTKHNTCGLEIIAQKKLKNKLIKHLGEPGECCNTGLVVTRQFDKSEKSCGHVINIIHSIHIFNVTGEVACECEQHCRFYDQKKKDFRDRK